MSSAERAHQQNQENIQRAKDNRIQKQAAQEREASLAKATIAILTQENEVNKQALQTLEQTEKDKLAEKERAIKAEQELAELKAKFGLVTVNIDKADKALESCLEDKSQAEELCHTQYSGLNPQQSYEEI